MTKTRAVNSAQSIIFLAVSGLKKKDSNHYFKYIVRELKQNPNDTYEKLGQAVQHMDNHQIETLNKNLKGLPFFKLRSFADGMAISKKIQKTTTPEQMKLNQKHWKEDYPKFMDFLQNIWTK